MARMLRHQGEKLPRKLKKLWRKSILTNLRNNATREHFARVSLYYSPFFGWTAEYIASRKAAK